MALLLERNKPEDAYSASFIGYTGRLLPPTGDKLPLPQAHDVEDAARRIVMKVSAFSSSEKIISLSQNTVFVHPVLFVAKGTHSLYLGHDGNPNGIQVTYPDDLRSDYCGKFDTPQPPLNIPPAPAGSTMYSCCWLSFFREHCSHSARSDGRQPSLGSLPGLRHKAGAGFTLSRTGREQMAARIRRERLGSA